MSAQAGLPRTVSAHRAARARVHCPAMVATAPGAKAKKRLLI
jgi:hypothetical protein